MLKGKRIVRRAREVRPLGRITIKNQCPRIGYKSCYSCAVRKVCDILRGVNDADTQ